MRKTNMTRRDYVMIANALRHGRASYIANLANADFRAGYDAATRELGYKFARLNPSFDQPRFLTDSGV